MSERLTYEELIAVKLEQLAPLPAMADAIWSRISDQLDLDMPSDSSSNNGGDSGSTLPGSGSFVWPGVGLIILAVAGILYWNAHRNNSPITIPQNRALDSEQIIERKAESDPVQPGFSPKDKGVTKEEGELQLPPVDTVMANENVGSQEGVLRDTNAIPPPIIPQNNTISSPPAGLGNSNPALKSAVDSPATKKPRGVTGISNSDYRIVPDKKDTGSKKNR